MYQEWDSPRFTVAQLADIARGFFEARSSRTALEIKSAKRTLVKAQIARINETQTIIIEYKGRKIRLTYLPLSHARDGLARLGGLLVTGRALKVEVDKQLFLDNIEQQFWENLDNRLAELTVADSARGTG